LVTGVLVMAAAAGAAEGAAVKAGR
jgi:hypothetical protein